MSLVVCRGVSQRATIISLVVCRGVHKESLMSRDIIVFLCDLTTNN
jgi:hypothetical protein